MAHLYIYILSTHDCMYVYMYVCVYAWMDGWMDACMYVCMHLCMYACAYIYTYTNRSDLARRGSEGVPVVMLQSPSSGLVVLS